MLMTARSKYEKYLKPLQIYCNRCSKSLCNVNRMWGLIFQVRMGQACLTELPFLSVP